MDNQNESSQHGNKAEGRLPPLDVTELSDAKATEPATAQQLADVKKQMNAFEKATLHWARIAVLLSALAAIFIGGQWYEMHKALILSQRPWLGISKATVRIEGIHGKVVFGVKNYGLSPALNSAFSSETDNAPIISQYSKTKIEQACARGEKLTSDPEGHGYSIFPDSSQLQDIMIDAKSQTAVYLLGCLTYADQFGALHHTRFCEVVTPPLNDGSELAPCFGGQNAD